MVAMCVAMISCGGSNSNDASTQQSASSDKTTSNVDPQLQSLPQPIIDYVQQHYPNAAIEYVDKDQEGDETFYEIRFKDGNEIVLDSKSKVIRTSDPSRQ